MTQLQKLIENKELYEKMATAARAFFRPNAAEAIAKDILAIANI